MTWLICTDTMPCSARNRATRQSSRVSRAAPNGSRAKIRRSNFQVQPPSGCSGEAATGRIEVSATCRAIQGRVGWSGTGRKWARQSSRVG